MLSVLVSNVAIVVVVVMITVVTLLYVDMELVTLVAFVDVELMERVSAAVLAEIDCVFVVAESKLTDANVLE